MDSIVTSYSETTFVRSSNLCLTSFNFLKNQNGPVKIINLCIDFKAKDLNKIIVRLTIVLLHIMDSSEGKLLDTIPTTQHGKMLSGNDSSTSCSVTISTDLAKQGFTLTYRRSQMPIHGCINTIGTPKCSFQQPLT